MTEGITAVKKILDHQMGTFDPCQHEMCKKECTAHP